MTCSEKNFSHSFKKNHILERNKTLHAEFLKIFSTASCCIKIVPGFLFYSFLGNGFFFKFLRLVGHRVANVIARYLFSLFLNFIFFFKCLIFD